MTATRVPRGHQRANLDSEQAFDPRLMAPLVVGAILNPLNSSIIAVSLVPIGQAFGAPTSQTAWLVSALYLATAIGQPVAGRLIDRHGPRPVYIAGSALVGIAGIVGALAPSLGVLVAARVLLGFGTCAGYPAAMYLIRSEAQRTGRGSPAPVLTALAISTQTTAVIGPTLGGLLIGVGGWRTTLAVNIPLALGGLVLGMLRLPRTSATQREAHARQAGGSDALGIALFAAMLTSLLLFLMKPQVDALYLLLISAASAACFATRELRVAGQPFIDLRILRGNTPLLATYGRAMLSAVITYCFVFGFTQWMMDDRGLSASTAGLVLLPMFATGIAVSAVSGRRPHVRGKLIVGGGAQLVACTLLLLLRDGSPIWLLVVITLIVGLPQGLNSLANQNALYHQADLGRIGSSAGLLRTFSYVGAITASAAGGAFFGHAPDTTGLHHLALFMFLVAAAFLALTTLDRSLAQVGRASSPEAGSRQRPDPLLDRPHQQAELG